MFASNEAVSLVNFSIWSWVQESFKFLSNMVTPRDIVMKTKL